MAGNGIAVGEGNGAWTTREGVSRQLPLHPGSFIPLMGPGRVVTD